MKTKHSKTSTKISLISPIVKLMGNFFHPPNERGEVHDLIPVAFSSATRSPTRIPEIRLGTKARLVETALPGYNSGCLDLDMGSCR